MLPRLEVATPVAQASKPHVTAAPSPGIVAQRLLPRDAGTTWAYISGNSNSPLTCPASLSLSLAGSGYVGCCNAVDCVGAYQLCVGANAIDSPCRYPDICSSIYTQWLSCTGSAPACVTYMLLESSAYQTGTAYSFTCGPSDTTIKVLTKPTQANGALPGASATNTKNGVLATSAAVNIFSSSGNAQETGSGGGSGSSGPGSSGSSSSGSSTNSSSGHLSLGSIIAIVVAILGVLVVVGCVVAFFIWKRQKKRKQEAEARRLAEARAEYEKRRGETGRWAGDNAQPHMFEVPETTVHGAPQAWGRGRM